MRSRQLDSPGQMLDGLIY